MNQRFFDKYITELCKEIALKNNMYAHRQRHACILTYRKHILSSAININLTNDFTQKFNSLKGIHAESLAIMRALHKNYSIIPLSELWVCRVGKYGDLLLSKPCTMCMQIIKSFGIKSIHYTLSNGQWYKETL
jgi:tRNA(Arg) A34 adenosine deaminase TadA